MFVASAMKRVDPSIEMGVLPMIDGGESFAKTIINIKGGELIYKKVTGPVGKKNSQSF
ncbi:glycerate kinase [Pallidibacillus thermolactis]|jgi:glycerate 2-kinase|uniref:glycerate kinase n=1 Tax=Pallidibacillus thermolactis TaxID=251051 RepID=UPI002E218DB8|nr:glycerate kinase [Pallidibacillus thermolactis]MED1673092.1 glycerate kinase [Pallidibacillus thermolactis subsp. kokeshiiformis]